MWKFNKRRPSDTFTVNIQRLCFLKIFIYGAVVKAKLQSSNRSKSNSIYVQKKKKRQKT